MEVNPNQELITLKEEKIRIEQENCELRKENLQLKYIKDQFLPKIINIMTQVKEQNNERDSKISFLASNFSFLYDQLLSKDITESKLIEKNNFLKNQINSLELKYKHDIDDFSRQNQENEAKIQNLQTDIFNILQKVSQTQDSDQPNNDIQEMQMKYNTKRLKYKLRIKELIQQNEKYKAEIDQIKIENQLLQKQQNEEKQIINDENKNLILQNKHIIEKKNVKIHSLKEEISILRKQQNQSQFNFTTVTNELNLQIQELTSKNTKYEEKIKSLQENKDELTQNVESFKKKINENELKIKSLESTIITNQQQNKSIETQVDQVNNLHEKKMKQLIEKYNEEIKEKNDLIENLKIIINKNMNEINKLVTENVNLSRKIEMYDEKYLKYKTKNFELKQNISKLQKSDDQTKNEIIIIQSNLKEKESLIEIKDKIIKELNEQITNQTIQKQSKSSSIQKFNDEVSKLNVELIELKQAYMIEKSKYESLRNLIKEKGNLKNQQNEKLISQLKKEIEMKNSIIEDLKCKIKNMNSEIQIRKNEEDDQIECLNINKLNKKIIQLNIELKNKINQNDNLILENEKLKNELIDLKLAKQNNNS